MTGTVLQAGFDDSAITRHLAMLAIMDARRFDGARREIGEFMVDDIHQNIESQKLYDGRPMPQSKAAIKRKGKTLLDRNHLMDSYVYQLDRNGVEFGSALVYAAIHHFGGDRAIPAKHGPVAPLPARPVMGIGERQERRIGDILIAEIRSIQ